jgi:hypothetical protein
MALRALRLRSGSHQGFKFVTARTAGVFINRHNYSRGMVHYQPNPLLCLVATTGRPTMGV